MRTSPLLLIALLFATTAFAQQFAPTPPLVSTTGSAQIRVVPDLADLDFEVEIRHVDLATARKQQAERTVKLLAALRAAGVAENELQTSQVQINPNYTDQRQETEKIRYYSVQQSISCTLHDITKVPDVTTAAVAAGATNVRNASLRTSQLRKYRDEARAKAIQAAREKAVALAGELGAKAGKPYTISEGSSLSYGDNFNGNRMINNIQVEADAPGGDGTTPTFAPGMIGITANVSISFVLE